MEGERLESLQEADKPPPASPAKSAPNPSHLNSTLQNFQKQLEVKESSICNLKKVIEQKEELLTATNEKLRILEQKNADFEEALVNLTQDDLGEAVDSASADTFVTSNSRAAQLETEKNDFRLKLAGLSSQVIGFCTKFKEDPRNFDLGEAVNKLEESLNSTNHDSNLSTGSFTEMTGNTTGSPSNSELEMQVGLIKEIIFEYSSTYFDITKKIIYYITVFKKF